MEGRGGKSEGKTGRRQKPEKGEETAEQDRMRKTSDSGVESTQEERWEAWRFKGTRWQQKGREGRTDRGEVTYCILWMENSTTATFFSLNQQFPERANCIAKQQLRRREGKMRAREGKRQEPGETLFAPRFFASTPQVIRQCSPVPREFLSGRIWISHWHLSLPHRAAAINISANKVCKHKRMYSCMHVQMC